MASSVSAWLESVFAAVLEVSLISGVVVLLALLLQRIFSSHVSPRWMHLIWLVVLLRFVLIIVPSSPSSFLNLLPVSESSSVVAQQEAPGELTSSESRIVLPEPAVLLVDESIEHVAVSATSSRVPNLLVIAGTLWLAGVVWFLFSLSIGFVQIRRLISRSQLPPTPLQNLFSLTMQQLGIRSTVDLRIVENDRLEIPSVVGFVRPVVLLPKWCIEELSDAKLKLLLAHELVHVQRFDGLMRLLSHLVVVIHWFNPLVYVAAKFADSTRELSCDRRVIEMLSQPNVDAVAESVQRIFVNQESIEQLYGKTILQVVERVSCRRASRTRFSHSPAIVGGFINQDQKLIKQRIAMLVRPSTRSLFPSFAGALALLLLVAVGFTAAQTPRTVEEPGVQIESDVQVQPSVQTPEETDVSPQLYTLRPTPGDTVEGAHEPMPGELLPLLDKAELVAVKMKVYEVSTSKLQQLGVDWSKVGEGVPAKVDSIKDLLVDSPTPGSAFGVGKVDGERVGTFLTALETHNIATLRDQPVVVAMLGTECEFRSGVDVPISVIDENGQKRIEFRTAGTIIRLLPHANDDETLTLEVKAEVAELAEELSAGTGQPGFRVRRINTGMDMKPGETLAMIGDFHKPKVDGKDNEKEATELVFLLTPRMLDNVDENVVEHAANLEPQPQLK